MENEPETPAPDHIADAGKAIAADPIPADPPAQKPIILRVIDFETTGLGPSDKVIESGWWDFWPKGEGFTMGKARYHYAPSIAPEARSACHIWPEDIADAKPFDPEDFIAEAVAAGISGFAAHNASFERQFLGRALEGTIPLICTFKAALRVWPDAPAFNNFALAYWLMDNGKIRIDRGLSSPPHRALPDSYVTALILSALYADGAVGKDLMRWSREPALYPTCPIGEFRGKPWGEVADGFLKWMANKPELDSDYRWCAQREIDRRGK